MQILVIYSAEGNFEFRKEAALISHCSNKIEKMASIAVSLSKHLLFTEHKPIHHISFLNN